VRETYGELTKRMAQLIGCQACTIATYDHQTREMRAQPPGYGVPDELVQSFRYKVDGPARDAWNFRFQGPLLANDIGQIPDLFSQWIEGFDLFNLLIVPMTHEGRITGLVYAANKPGGFAGDDSKLLTIFASQAAVIIEDARLYEETRRRAEEMTSVYNIGVATTSTLSLEEVLKSVCEQVSLLMKVSSFYIALYDAEKEELRFELALDEGMPVEKFTRRVANGGGLSGWVVQSREPLLLRDMEKEELPTEAIVVGEPTRSWLGVPLLHRDQVVGVMGVQSYQPNAFDEDDQQLLSTIAAQVAIAVENARLFAETKRKANDLGLLLGTSTAISSSLDLDQILETVAHQITASLVATFCRISLLDEAGESLVIHAGSPIRDRKAEDGFGRQCPLDIIPWHRQVIETGQSVVLRQDVPELALSDEECKMALTEEVKSAALIPLIVGGRVLGVISLGEERCWERSPFTQEKMELCQSIATQAAVAIENARLYEELQQSFIQTIATLAAAVEAKDPYTGGHSQGTMELAAAIAQDVGLDDEEVELLRYACLLHDVGKIGISEQILGKPGPLDEKEWEIIRRHPALGASIVKRAALLQKLVPIILHHHEHYDGHGYPEGLRGEDIPLKARILAVADAYQAMTSDRAYRPAMTVEQALTTLQQGADEQWDGKLVDVLYRIIREQGESSPGKG
jgi:putative nucleotidyltransferase with HDIG domain